MKDYEIFKMLKDMRRQYPECYLAFTKLTRLFPVGKGLDKKG